MSKRRIKCSKCGGTNYREVDGSVNSRYCWFEQGGFAICDDCDFKFDLYEEDVEIEINEYGLWKGLKSFFGGRIN